MTIIDKSYYQGGDMRIGQIGSQEVQDKLKFYLDNFEPEYLRLVLGVKTFDDLMAAIALANDDLSLVAEPFYSLLHGKEFLAPVGLGSAQIQYWPGFMSKKDSPIAKYIYFNYVRSEATFLTGAGATVPKLENASRVNANSLQRFQWNDMVDKNIILFAYMRSNMDLFPDWPYNSYGWVFPERIRNIGECFGGFVRSVSALENLFIKINDFNI